MNESIRGEVIDLNPPSPDGSSMSESETTQANTETVLKYKNKHVMGKVDHKLLEFLIQAILSLVVVAAAISFIYVFHGEETMHTASFSTLSGVLGLWFPRPKVKWSGKVRKNNKKKRRRTARRGRNNMNNWCG